MRKKKYIPDLSKQMASQEANYLRLMKLMPDFDDCDDRRFQLSWQHHRVTVELIVEERFAYTSTLRVKQSFGAQPWVQMPDLIVRIYHDARMAEVICKQQRKQLKANYPYPNKNMHLPDEKAQLNEYLAEWLAQCLAHGHNTESMAIV